MTSQPEPWLDSSVVRTKLICTTGTERERERERNEPYGSNCSATKSKSLHHASGKIQLTEPSIPPLDFRILSLVISDSNCRRRKSSKEIIRYLADGDGLKNARFLNL